MKRDLGLLLLRLGAGVTLMAHGYPKLFGGPEKEPPQPVAGGAGSELRPGGETRRSRVVRSDARSDGCPRAPGRRRARGSGRVRRGSRSGARSGDTARRSRRLRQYGGSGAQGALAARVLWSGRVRVPTPAGAGRRCSDAYRTWSHLLRPAPGSRLRRPIHRLTGMRLLRKRWRAVSAIAPVTRTRY